MTTLLFTLAALAHLLLAAHALRQGDTPVCAALLTLALGLATRRGFLRLLAALALIGGAVLWVRTGLDFVRLRLALEAPWLRLAVIMAALTALSLGAGLWMLSERAKTLFRVDRRTEAAQAAAAVLALGIMLLARSKASLPVLLADRFWPGWGLYQAVLLAFYAAWLTGRMLEPAAHRKLRPRIWALFSAVFFLQLALGLSGFTDFLMSGRLHLPVPALIAAGPIYRGGGLFMPILFASTVLLVGPAWCSHLCYIGAWDDMASRCGPKIPRALSKRWMLLGRAGTLLLTCGAAVVLRLLDVPPAAAALWAAGFGLAGVGIMLGASRRQGVMAHCTAFCPIGLLGNLLGRLVPWRMRLGPGCTKCQACSRACRYSALTPADIEAGKPGLSCTLCGDCVSACQHDSMHYHFPGLKPESARTFFLILAVALHAAFLGVARI